MKKFYIVVITLLLILSILNLYGCKEPVVNDDIIRIHIRANSNQEEDQSVKYVIKDLIVDYLNPLSKNLKTKQEMYYLLEDSLDTIENIANRSLKEQGYQYFATVSIKKEEFPLRSYDSVTLPAGLYDALIINLGEGKGDNWWCVAFPPLCFIGAESNGEDYFRYKSKLIELIRG